MEKIIAPMARTKPNSKPKTRAVKIIANTLAVVPEQRKAVAGNIPAPRLYFCFTVFTS